MITDVPLDRAVAPLLPFTRAGAWLDLSLDYQGGYSLMTSRDLTRWEAVSGVKFEEGRAIYRIDPLANHAAFFQLRASQDPLVASQKNPLALCSS